MNLTAPAAAQLVQEILELYGSSETGDTQVIFAPSSPFLGIIAPMIAGLPNVHLSAQNLHQEEGGAYTGEISASQITSVGATHVLVGHSERREYFGEDNALLASKIDKALSHGLVPIYCFGETLEQRESGKALDVIREQVSGGTFHLDAESFGKLILAYEPVWAIGTGKTASPEQAQEVHAFIRGLLKEKYGEAVADETSILYGGSVKPANADELFAQPDIDGGLVGGASLKAPDFAAIINAL